MRDGWHFKLGNKTVREPIGWDGVKFTLRRNTDYSGMEFLFSDEITFTEEGANVLRMAYEYYGIDAQLEIWFKYVLCEEVTFEFKGIINFNIYKETEQGVTVGIKQSGFEEKFKNRMDTEVNILAAKSLDNVSIEPFSLGTIQLHSKQINFLSTWRINPLLNFEFGRETNEYMGKDFAVPFELKAQEVEESMQPSYYFPWDENPIFYSGFTYPAGVADREINVKGRLRALIYNGSPDFIAEYIGDFYLIVRDRESGQNISEFQIARVQFGPGGVGPVQIDSGDFNFTLNIQPDHNIFFAFRAEAFIFELAVIYDEGVTYLSFEEPSIYPTTPAKVSLAYEFLNRIVYLITGQADGIRSSFFGRIDSQPYSYDVDGEGSLLALTNGFAIRQFLDADGKTRGITCSFKKAFDSLSAIYNLGMRVEQEAGQFYVRIEPKEYFYNANAVYQVSYVSELTKAVNLNLIPNEFEAGYNKWESEDINGIDEFNTKRNYSLPVVSNKRKFSAISDFIAGGYPIEFTRRQQFAEKPTTDWRFDEDIFVIALIRKESGYEPERSAGYEPIRNLLAPDTSYNLRISPARMTQNWLNVLSVATVKKADPMLLFVSGTGNYKMRTDELAEDQSFVLADPLYQPETLTFSYPISFNQFLLLRQNAVFAIAVSCEEASEMKGFIQEISYSPNREGGIAEFTLIRA